MLIDLEIPLLCIPIGLNINKMITLLIFTEGLITLILIGKIVHSIRTSHNPKKALQFTVFQVILIIVLTVLYIMIFNYVLDR